MQVIVNIYLSRQLVSIISYCHLYRPLSTFVLLLYIIENCYNTFRSEESEESILLCIGLHSHWIRATLENVHICKSGSDTSVFHKAETLFKGAEV